MREPSCTDNGEAVAGCHSTKEWVPGAEEGKGGEKRRPTLVTLLPLLFHTAISVTSSEENRVRIP